MAASSSTSTTTKSTSTSAATQQQGIGMEIERAKSFPLKNIADVVQFFRTQLEGSDPDLTLLSIVAGYIENNLTSSGIPAAVIIAGESGSEATKKLSPNGSKQTDGLSNFPVVTFESVDELYRRFQTILSVIEKPKGAKQANRVVIKRVSDIIWHSLIRSSYKDRAHLQSLYSYLSGNKLDCFGVAFAVVAGCQLLGYRDVHLSISEDHAWVVFGKQQTESIEVTWHGKGHEDKRGQDVKFGYNSRSWLYLAGYPVKCDRYMEVAAIVSAINPSLTLNSDCLEVADLQQNLLWLLYDLGHLQKYPMGLGSLGELEEQEHTEGRPTCVELYAEAIKSAQQNYKNHHVYPYTCQGNFYYRREMYREAFAAWANAGDVIRLYNYSRDDEEIYKEFLDIANEMIPCIMKAESSGHSARSILRDSQCFANIVRFYDGICQWEEGSLTPILHIGWAKPLVNTISKFDFDIRSQVVIKVDDEVEDLTSKNSRFCDEKKSAVVGKKDLADVDADLQEGNNNCIKKGEAGNKVLASTNGEDKEKSEALAALTAACGEKILNPDFLLQGGGHLFADNKQKLQTETLKAQVDTTLPEIKVEKLKQEDKLNSSIQKNDENDIPDEFKPKQPIITLYSQKMKALKDLLLAEKLNTHAISLQVTAQSHVAPKKGRTDKSSVLFASSTSGSTASASANTHHNTNTEPEITSCSRPKRTRRE